MNYFYSRFFACFNKCVNNIRRLIALRKNPVSPFGFEFYSLLLKKFNCIGRLTAVKSRKHNSRICRNVFHNGFAVAVICYVTSSLSGYKKFFPKDIIFFNYHGIKSFSCGKYCRKKSGRSAADHKKVIHRFHHRRYRCRVLNRPRTRPKSFQGFQRSFLLFPLIL